MRAKRVIGIGAASLMLATMSVFGATAAHAEGNKASYSYYPTLAKCEQGSALRALFYKSWGKVIVKTQCWTVRPGEKYMGEVTFR